MGTLTGAALEFACNAPEACIAGALECGCADGELCLSGLHCYNGKCLPAPDTGTDATSPSPTNPTTSASETTGPTVTGTTSTGDEPTTGPGMTTGELETVSACHDLDEIIVEGPVAGFWDTIELDSDAKIAGVRVEVVARTTDAAEVHLTLAGAQHSLALYTAERCHDGVDVAATFDAAAANSIGQSCPDGEGVVGSVRPDGDFAEFVGRRAGGPWTLHIRDLNPSDTPLTLERWCVHVDVTGGTPETDPKTGEFQWVRPTALGDAGRRTFAAWAYDSDRDVVVGYGGCNELTLTYNCEPLAQPATVEWDGVTWNDLDIPHPGGLAANWHKAAMVYDPVAKNMVLFGGYREHQGFPPRDETWTYDGAAWTQRQPATTPGQRASHTMVWDPVHAQAIVFGGHHPQGQVKVLDDVWAWDDDTWTQLASNGGPGPRHLHRATWHPTLARMIVIGGFGAVGYPDSGLDGQMWAYDPATGDWQQYDDVPFPVGAGGLVHDSRRDRLILFGVTASNSHTYEWDGTTWHGLTGPAWLPAERYANGLVWLPSLEVVFLYGGWYSIGIHETWYYAAVP